MKSIIRDMRALIDFVYPLYKLVEFAQDVDPNVVIGHGTVWERFAPGRVTVGSGTTTDDNGDVLTFTMGETGGASKRILRAAIGAVNNNVNSLAYIASDQTQYMYDNPPTFALMMEQIDDSFIKWNHSTKVTDHRGNESIGIMQPYVAVSRWYRTA